MIDKQKYIEKMKELQNARDTEGSHIDADDLLCELLVELGFQEVVDEYNKIGKWYA